MAALSLLTIRLETLTGSKSEKSEAGEALEISVVPAGIRSADQAATHAVIRKNNSVVAETGDDDGRLRAGGSARRRRHRCFQAINFACRSVKVQLDGGEDCEISVSTGIEFLRVEQLPTPAVSVAGQTQ